jgi:hypothetical protein
MSMTRMSGKALQNPAKGFDVVNPELSTTLVGLSTLEQLEHAGQNAKKGPLPAEALELISTIQRGFVGEAR